MSPTIAGLVMGLLLATGQGAMPRWCGEHCEVYAAHLSAVIDQAAVEQGVSPTLLVAVALHESRLDPNAQGSVGEFGPWQLHPKSRWGRAALFMCDVEPPECLLAQARIVAWLLAAHKDDCGSWRAAFGAYNSGRCSGSPAYSERLMDVWRGL